MQQKWVVSEAYNQKKVIRFLSLVLQTEAILPLQKALKNKDIKVNDKRINRDIILNTGDSVSIYLPDKFIQKAENSSVDLSVSAKQLAQRIIYEDKQILIIDKPQGLTVHPGNNTPPNTSLIEILRFLTKNEDLTLTHRLDRNTGGLVLLAKNKKIARAISFAIKEGQMIKRYHCLVKGVPEMGEAVLLSDGDSMLEVRAFLEKPPMSDEVYIHETAKSSDLPIITRYRVQKVFTSLNNLTSPVSELEVELVTGRTHQIRAHLAFLNHPILGDGKYGRNDFNLNFTNKSGAKLKYQQLFATSIMFGNNLSSEIKNLKNKTFKITPNYEIQLKKD